MLSIFRRAVIWARQPGGWRFNVLVFVLLLAALGVRDWWRGDLLGALLAALGALLLLAVAGLVALLRGGGRGGGQP
ncbi:MAG: hypothetical protein N2483_10970 [Burkholderiaceae bacterium]|nr:hypothetical protein [Burkholderiaceae bacterium]